ncbi:MAG: hypothetical protein PHE20_00680 [Patescibacteria group bacterium]|nr:hypothetical protein [Patescibacteria group bacterium]
MSSKENKSKEILKTIKSTDTSWLNKRLAPKYFWPIFGVLFFLFLLSIFNLLSLLQIRQEMNRNLEDLRTNISLSQDMATKKNSDESLFSTSTALDNNIPTEISSSSFENIQNDEASLSSALINIETGATDLATASSAATQVILVKPIDSILAAIFGSSPQVSNSDPNVKEVKVDKTVSVPAPDPLKISYSNDFIPPISEQLLSGRLSSVSDTFSSLSNINQSETDMFWDENMTVFVFPPVYELKKQSDCSAPDCGLSRAMTDIQSSCLSPGCLSKSSESKLSFAGKELQLPPVFKDRKISKINIFPLANSWLIGIVTGPSTAEQGWVYRFDGLSFSPLITNETEYQIKPLFQKGGGEIAFGGDSKDFLVLYSGYDAIAYRFREGGIEDVSKYFGLRVSGGGFKAQILRIGEGQSSIYYVCGLDENEAKIIKIWSKDALNSAGALDFSTVFADSSFYPQSILCGISDVQTKKLLIAAKIKDRYELWNFQDKGFDNSSSRQVTSINLKDNNTELVKAAVISDVGVETKSGCPGSSASVYLANERGAFNYVNTYLWHGFAKLGSELYWRFVFQPENDPFYSPWFSHINRLSYLSPE